MINSYRIRILSVLVIIVFIASMFLSVSIVSAAKPKTLWKYDRFVNSYSLWKQAECNVKRSRVCPAEFGWQGERIEFHFRINDKKKLTKKVRFNFLVTYVDSLGASPAIDIYVRPYGGALKRVGGKKIWRTGEFGVNIPKKHLKNGWNVVMIQGKNIKPGYGSNAPVFVLGEVRLDNKFR